MNDEYRQQALDNFRNALGRLEQSDFPVEYRQTWKGVDVHVWDTEFVPKKKGRFKTIINLILRLKKDE